MSILEPRPSYDDDDPLLDAVLGLYSSAQRVRAALESVAPERRATEKSHRGSLDPIPEPVVALLLGILSTSETLERVFSEACPPLVETSRSRAASSQGSLWR